MFPNQGDLVEIRFNNGVSFDAIVDTWTDQKSIIVLPATKETVIIQKTLQDVLLVKIIKHPNVAKIREEIESIKSKGITADNVNRYAELQLELVKQEKYHTARALTGHKEPRVIKYEQPRNIPVTSPSQHPQQKASTDGVGFGAQLQSMFNKKH